MTRHLFVMDPVAPVDPFADTTFDFILHAQHLGHEVWMTEIHELSSEGARGFAHARPLAVHRPDKPGQRHHDEGPAEKMVFDVFDVIWMRKDPPVDDRFMLACMMLDRHDPAKTLMMNAPEGLRIANEKLFGLFADEVGPETVVAARAEVLREAFTRYKKAVLKPIGFAGGSGVMVFDHEDKNLGAAIDVLTESGRRPCVVQRFLPDVSAGDKRVILLGGEPIGALNRTLASGDNRANMHVGGGIERGTLDDADRKIAARLKPELLRLGLHFVGIDVIGGRLTEVNVTSPTGIQEIDRLDGRKGDDTMSAQVFQYVQRLLDAR